MDNPRDVKILVLFLGFLAICTGKQMRAPDAGYNYNRGQNTNNLNGILKSVLVHESTGHGKHSGSVSSSGGNSGVNFKVAKQPVQKPSFGYSYPSNQQMNGNIRPVDVTTIRVFHESSGNTGNIVRNYNQPSPRGFSHTKASPNPSQTLRYIHENALSRSRPDQKNIDRSHGQSSSDLNAFRTGLATAGYQYMSSQQAGSGGNFYGAAQQAQANGYQYPGPNQVQNGNQRNTGNIGTNSLQSAILSISHSQNVNLQSVTTGSPSSNGYQYSNPAHDQKRGSDNLENGFGFTGSENVRNTFTSPAQYIKPTKSEHGQAASSAYQYPGPYQSLNTGTSDENQRNTFTSSSQVQNVNIGNTEPASQGYQYSRQNGIKNSLLMSNGYMYSNPIRAQNVDPRNTAGGSQVFPNEQQQMRPDLAPNGYQYQGPIQGNDNQQNTGNGSPLQVAISSLSQVENTVHRTSSNGYQYPSPNQDTKINLGNNNQRNKFSSSIQGQNLEINQSDSNGYQYPSQVQVFNDDKNLQGGSLLINNEGYRYESPRSMDSQGGAEQIDISKYSSSKQLNSLFQGYRYENSGLSQNASPTEDHQYFDQSLKESQRNEKPRTDDHQYPNPISQTGQNQATGTTQSANGGYRYDGPIQALEVSYNSQQTLENAYHYDNPEKPAVTKSTFKGQSYLPLPQAANDSGYQHENQNSPRTNGYMYDKSELSNRPQTTFKGQPYLPLPEQSSSPHLRVPSPPVSGGW